MWAWTARNLRMRQVDLNPSPVAADQHLARQGDGLQGIGRRGRDAAAAARHHRHHGLCRRSGRGSGGGFAHDGFRGEQGFRRLRGRRPSQEHEPTLAGVQTVLVGQRRGAGDRLAVVKRRAGARHRLDVVPSIGANDAELLARTGDVEEHEVGGFAASDHERRGAQQRMQLLGGRVVQGGVDGLVHGRVSTDPNCAEACRRFVSGMYCGTPEGDLQEVYRERRSYEGMRIGGRETGGAFRSFRPPLAAAKPCLRSRAASDKFLVTSHKDR